MGYLLRTKQDFAATEFLAGNWEGIPWKSAAIPEPINVDT